MHINPLFAAALLILACATGRADDKEFTGEIGCAECAFKSAETCAPAIKVDGKVHLIEADAAADEKTKKAVAACASCKDTKMVTIKVSNPDSKEKWKVVSLTQK